MMDERLQLLTQLGVSTTAMQFKGPVAETVVRATSRLNADLVIMGSHHHSTLCNLFVGSTTSDVLKKAKVRLFIVP